jgi:hypothetical protein
MPMSHAAMTEIALSEVNPLPRRIVLTDAAPESFSELSRPILAKLGYQIVTNDEFPHVAAEQETDRPDLRIIDERNLIDLYEDSGPPVPIIVLTGRQGVSGVDQRVVGALKRPAGLHELYRLMQQVLEDTPRSAPRVPTHIQATASRQGREWGVAVLSLSENGCLIRSAETILLGSDLTLEFTLPRFGPVRIDTEAAYQLVPDVGLIFHATPPAVREAVSGFVTQVLIDA